MRRQRAPAPDVCRWPYGVTGVCSVVTGMPVATEPSVRAWLGLAALVAATPARIMATTAMLQNFMALLPMVKSAPATQAQALFRSVRPARGDRAYKSRPFQTDGASGDRLGRRGRQIRHDSNFDFRLY